MEFSLRNAILNSPSSLASSFGASAAASPPAAAAPPAAAGAAAAPPPEPMLVKISLTSLPSRALAKREVQMGSTSATLAAVMRELILSACGDHHVSHGLLLEVVERLRHTVISTPSSARMRALYAQASSAVDIAVVLFWWSWGSEMPSTFYCREGLLLAGELMWIGRKSLGGFCWL